VEGVAVRIRVKGVTVTYGGFRALSGASLEVGGGEILSLVGPNGSGKTTLLRVIDGVLRPRRGTVYLDGSSLRELPPREAARRMGMVPQRTPPAGMLTVFDFVLTGRRPHLGLLPSRRDEEKALEAMREVGVLHLAERTLEGLSGGELQRVSIARALAGEPEVLLLDEPTSNLDPRYQVEILELLRDLRSKGLCLVMATHDLTHAYRISDKVVVLKRGRIFSAGSPEEVFRPEVLSRVYGVRLKVLPEHRIVAPA
jgi:iron complex transport system ATP-binding protein